MFRYYKKPFTALFEDVHLFNRSRSPELCLIIQKKLVKQTKYIESRIRILRKNQGDLKKLLGQCHPKNKAIEIKSAIDNVHLKLKDYNNLLYICREIGDGLAFSVFNKWKWDLKPLSFKESHGFISGKKGFRLEWNYLKYLCLIKKHRAILNDLTTCLKYGDITYVDRGHMMFVEAKTILNDGAIHQLEKTRKLLDYLSEDETDRLYNMHGQFKRTSVHNKEVYYSNVMNSLIKESCSKTTASKKVEEGLYYFASSGFETTFFDQIINDCKGDEIIVMLVNSFKQNNLGYRPFTLTISPQYLVDFYIGKYVLGVVVNMSYMKRKLAQSGIHMEKSRQYSYILDSKSQTRNVSIGKHFFNRIFTEFISINWFIEEVISCHVKTSNIIS